MIELLMVLLMVSILSLLALPNLYHIWVDHQTKQFFTVLDSDVLLIQNQAMAAQHNVRIFFEEDHYVVMEDGRIMKKRDYPSGFRYRPFNTNRIKFNNLGSTSAATSFFFYDQNGGFYRAVFPLGKGRHYIEQY